MFSLFSAKPKSKVTRAKLVNKEYYAECREKMEEKERHGAHPTVGDLIKAMREQGNASYFDAFSEMNNLKKREEKFKHNGLVHELGHVACNIGHTPQQEMFVLYFNEGLKLGDQAGIISDYFHDNLSTRELMWRGAALDYQSKRADKPSKADRAIYFAAGLYMRQRLEEYIRLGLDKQDHNAQLAFCETYPATDHTSDSIDFSRDLFAKHNTQILNAPYQLALFSGEPTARRKTRHVENLENGAGKKNDMHGRGEWASIVAVATGLCEPKDTDYPERLTTVKQTLLDTFLFYDLKHSKEKSESVTR